MGIRTNELNSPVNNITPHFGQLSFWGNSSYAEFLPSNPGFGGGLFSNISDVAATIFNGVGLPALVDCPAVILDSLAKTDDIFIQSIYPISPVIQADRVGFVDFFSSGLFSSGFVSLAVRF